MIDFSTGRRWTYAQFGDDVDALATGLLVSGIAVGDRVGIWAPNCPEWTLLQFASAAVGAILVTIDPAYRTREARVRAAPGRRQVVGLRPAVQRLGLRSHGQRGPLTLWVPRARHLHRFCAVVRAGRARIRPGSAGGG